MYTWLAWNSQKPTCLPLPPIPSVQMKGLPLHLNPSSQRKPRVSWEDSVPVSHCASGSPEKLWAGATHMLSSKQNAETTLKPVQGLSWLLEQAAILGYKL